VADDHGIVVPFPVGARNFYVLRNVQPGFGAQSSFVVVPGALSSRVRWPLWSRPSQLDRRKECLDLCLILLQHNGRKSTECRRPAVKILYSGSHGFTSRSGCSLKSFAVFFDLVIKLLVQCIKAGHDRFHAHSFYSLFAHCSLIRHYVTDQPTASLNMS